MHRRGLLKCSFRKYELAHLQHAASEKAIREDLLHPCQYLQSGDKTLMIIDLEIVLVQYGHKNSRSVRASTSEKIYFGFISFVNP